MKTLFIICTALTLLGCKPPPAEKAAAKQRRPASGDSTMQTAIDGFTGRTAVRAGRKAQDDIRQISAGQKENLDEVLGK